MVGVLGLGVQAALLWLLMAVGGFNYLLATALAVEGAILHNFFWHERWTWSDRTRPDPSGWMGRLARFNLTTGAVSIAGNLAAMAALVGGSAAPLPGRDPDRGCSVLGPELHGN